MGKKAPEVSPLIFQLSAYIANATRKSLPAAVVEKAKHHVLDTLSAMVSGSRLLPGRRAISYVRTLGGTRESTVVGTRLVTAVANAALANGMSAHADETDDTHDTVNMHPGCGVISAALAVAERENRDGKSLLRAIVLGYDIGCRIPRALHPDPAMFRAAGRCNQSVGGIFGAAAAAGALSRLNSRQVRYLLSYASQQASGVRSFMRDREHVLKAFLFGGMTAHNGVAAASMVASGFTGVEDEFTGELNRNFFSAFSPNPTPEHMTRGLGSTYEIMNTSIKKWPVGAPVQAALDALTALMEKHHLRADDIEQLVARTPANEMAIVDNSHMGDISMQHILAITLLDNKLTFDSVHEAARMRDTAVVNLKKRIKILGSAELTKARPPRQCIIEIATRDARQLRHRTRVVRGTPSNPMTREEVAGKSMELTAPVLGKRRAAGLIDAVFNLERIKNVRVFRALLSA